MQLVARRDVDAALAAADGADALALGRGFLVDFVFARLFANRETDAAASQQAALFLLFQQVMRVGLGGRTDIDITAGLQVHVPISGNGRTGDRQVIAGADADAVTTQQCTVLARGSVVGHSVAAALVQEAFFLGTFLAVARLALGGRIEGDILFCLQGDGTLVTVKGAAGDRDIALTPDNRDALLTAEGAAGADFALGLFDAMAFGFALVFVFAVQILRAAARVFNGHVLRAGANTPLFALNLRAFRQQLVTRHQSDALITAECA